MNRIGRLLVSHRVVGLLIEAITTRAGLTVNAKLDKTQYPINTKVTTEAIASVNLKSHALCMGKWAYAIKLSRCLCRPVLTQALFVLLFPPIFSRLIG
jgi:DDE family transposase